MPAEPPHRVGLIGWPVGHSRSPAMHNAAFRALGLPWEYWLLPVEPRFLEDAVRGLRGLNFAGANVTVPHKEGAMAWLDELSPEARAIGAVNTIVNRGGQLVGYNTDASGFLRALREADFDPQGCRAVVVGAGGASRAVLYALLNEGAQVTVANRTLARAARLAQEMGALFGQPVSVLELADTAGLQAAMDGASLLVNSSSAGMHPHEQQRPLPASLILRPSLTVCDLVYNPRDTHLLQAARAQGCATVGGLGMLIHQGAAAFTLWTGIAPPVDVMRAALA